MSSISGLPAIDNLQPPNQTQKIQPIRILEPLGAAERAVQELQWLPRLEQSVLSLHCRVRLGCPGGCAGGFEVARALDVALDIFLVRKLGVPKIK